MRINDTQPQTLRSYVSHDVLESRPARLTVRIETQDVQNPISHLRLILSKQNTQFF